MRDPAAPGAGSRAGSGGPTPEAWELAAFAERAEALRRGTLEGNVVAFVRLLREAGLPVTTGDAIEAARALLAVGVETREGARAALAATLLRRPAERALFEALFEQFWSGRAPRAAPPRPPREVAAPGRSAEPPGRLARSAVPEARASGGEAVPPPPGHGGRLQRAGSPHAARLLLAPAGGAGRGAAADPRPRPPPRERARPAGVAPRGSGTTST